jgi:sugar lactone lactonase YvrE
MLRKSTLKQPQQFVEEKKKVKVEIRSNTIDRIKICFIFSLISTLVILLPLTYFALTRFGIGSNFPNHANFSSILPILSEDSLKVIAELPTPPGNVAISAKDRIFFNFHPEYNPTIKILELKNKTYWKPFPSVEFQSLIITCLSLRIDKLDRLWLLDFANHGILGNSKLYAFDLKNKDQIVKNYTFPHLVAGFGSMLNDFQVDPTGRFIYIVDTSIIAMTPALIVYSIATDTSFRILSSHPSMFGDSTFLNISGNMLKFGPLGVKLNVDSVALDRTGNTLYYGAVTSNKLYSISTKHLLFYLAKAREDNSSAMSDMLNKNVQKHVRLVSNEKPATDGISTDATGNVWMTSFEDSSISIAVPRVSTAPIVDVENASFFSVYKVVQSKQLLRWPDGLCFGSEGLYITSSALHLKLTGITRNISTQAPFHILRIDTKHLYKLKILTKNSIKFEMPYNGH